MPVKWRIAELLEERGLTAYQLAQLTGLSIPTCYELVKDKPVGRIMGDTLEKLCVVLECTPGDLLSYEEEPEKKKRGK